MIKIYAHIYYIFGKNIEMLAENFCKIILIDNFSSR